MNLVCTNRSSNDYKVSMFGVLLMLGQAVGSLTLTGLSDIYGRKLVLLAILTLSGVIFILLTAFQDNYGMTLLCVFINGMASSVLYSVSYMYSTELTSNEGVEFFGSMCLIADSLTSVVMGVYWYFVKTMDANLIFLVFS